MIFKYKSIDKIGTEIEGTIDSSNIDSAIETLQGRGLVISSIQPEESDLLSKLNSITFFESASNRDIVLLSRQIATLFEAQVSALRVFRLLAKETGNEFLSKKMIVISDDLQKGYTLSKALSKHPKVFSQFYVNMVASGEESGKLSEVFSYLADYLERMYDLTSKAKNAFIYPAFVIGVFIIVMGLMLTMVIPKISQILLDAGQEIPFFTKVVIGLSNFLVQYGLFFLIILVIAGFFTFRFALTQAGKDFFSKIKLSIPYVGSLYQKLYLARIASNMHTMLVSGIPIVKAIDNSASVVGNSVYSDILKNVSSQIRSGKSLSLAFREYDEIPGIFTQMIGIGEETGNSAFVLKTLANFYEKEVKTSVDTLVDMIEPILIVLLGLGVGGLLTSVLVPIYNISAGI